MIGHRVVGTEVLDHLAPTEPAAQRARRDLARLHPAMGTRSIVRRGWLALGAGATAPLKILELGAGGDCRSHARSAPHAAVWSASDQA